MSIEADEIEQDDTTADQDEVETPQEDGNEGGDETEDEPRTPTAPAEDPDAPLTVSLGDEADDEDADDLPPADEKAGAAWKALKSAKKQLERENAELKAKVAPPAPPPTVKEPGPRPKLADFGGDEDKLSQAIVQWAKDTDAKEAEQVRVKNAEEKIAASYREKIAKLNRPDFIAQQNVVAAALSQAQQAILLSKTKETAVLVYGLGKDPAKLRQLAALTDPLDFHAALRDVERTMKVTDKRRPPNPPETVVRGNSGGGGTLNNKYREKLEAEADRTNNRAKLQAYDREQAARARKK